jgi:hypothetical protein
VQLSKQYQIVYLVEARGLLGVLYKKIRAEFFTVAFPEFDYVPWKIFHSELD